MLSPQRSPVPDRSMHSSAISLVSPQALRVSIGTSPLPAISERDGAAIIDDLLDSLVVSLSYEEMAGAPFFSYLQTRCRECMLARVFRLTHIVSALRSYSVDVLHVLA